jgi:hypothetical protein
VLALLQHHVQPLGLPHRAPISPVSRSSRSPLALWHCSLMARNAEECIAP